MADMVDILNRAGAGFCGFAGAMLVQSGALIVLLYLVDLLIRKRVRAVVRYGMWMLVFVKLVLPPTLCLPTGIGYWCGVDIGGAERQVALEVPAEAEAMAPQYWAADVPAVPVLPERRAKAEVPAIADEGAYVPAVQRGEREIASVDSASTNVSISWQAAVFVVWVVGVVVLSVLLLQRYLFVRGLIAQSEAAGGRVAETLRQCAEEVGVRGEVELRLCKNMLSPAACGLVRPVILMPGPLLEGLSREKLRAVLVHELAHIKRGDLWVNFVQTALQIVYFYNPLLWFANGVVRGIREKAVDEMVLTRLGGEAKRYSDILIDVAETAFSRPHFSLRLVGVVESKKALAGRIKHILGQPLPKSAKVGLAGLAAIIICGAVLLPMAKAAYKPPEFVIKGTVTDFETGEPIAGAKVGDADKYGEGKQTAVTDVNGNYQYKTWYEEHGVEAEADGYKSQAKQLVTKLFGSKKEVIIEFKLVRETTAESSAFKTALENGLTVELVGVCVFEGGRVQNCWKPDGGKLDERIRIKYQGAYEDKAFGFVFKSAQSSEMTEFEASGTTDRLGRAFAVDANDEFTELTRNGKQHVKLVRIDGRKITDVEVALAPKWLKRSTYDGKYVVGNNDPKIRFVETYETGDGIKIIFENNYKSHEVNAQAVLSDEAAERLWQLVQGGRRDKFRIDARFDKVINEGQRQEVAIFEKLKKTDVKYFEFFTRPHPEKAAFKNVSLEPGSKTDVEIMTDTQKVSGEAGDKGGASAELVESLGPVIDEWFEACRRDDPVKAGELRYPKGSLGDEYKEFRAILGREPNWKFEAIREVVVCEPNYVVAVTNGCAPIDEAFGEKSVVVWHLRDVGSSEWRISEPSLRPLRKWEFSDKPNILKRTPGAKLYKAGPDDNFKLTQGRAALAESPAPQHDQIDHIFTNSKLNHSLVVFPTDSNGMDISWMEGKPDDTSTGQDLELLIRRYCTYEVDTRDLVSSQVADKSLRWAVYPSLDRENQQVFPVELAVKTEKSVTSHSNCPAEVQNLSDKRQLRWTANQQRVPPYFGNFGLTTLEEVTGVEILRQCIPLGDGRAQIKIIVRAQMPLLVRMWGLNNRRYQIEPDSVEPLNHRLSDNGVLFFDYGKNSEGLGSESQYSFIISGLREGELFYPKTTAMQYIRMPSQGCPDSPMSLVKGSVWGFDFTLESEQCFRITRLEKWVNIFYELKLLSIKQ